MIISTQYYKIMAGVEILPEEVVEQKIHFDECQLALLAKYQKFGSGRDFCRIPRPAIMGRLFEEVAFMHVDAKPYPSQQVLLPLEKTVDFLAVRMAKKYGGCLDIYYDYFGPVGIQGVGTPDALLVNSGHLECPHTSDVAVAYESTLGSSSNLRGYFRRKQKNFRRLKEMLPEAFSDAHLIAVIPKMPQGYHCYLPVDEVYELPFTAEDFYRYCDNFIKDVGAIRRMVGSFRAPA